MKTVVFHPAAREEVDEAATYYESRRGGLGREFRIDFEAALGRVVQNPLAYAVELGEFRPVP